jgi:hypothetical protein
MQFIGICDVPECLLVIADVRELFPATAAHQGKSRNAESLESPFNDDGIGSFAHR